ncbi:MAG: BLUF domain-containing protein [Bdellovibrionales bacterium]|nr:BLUF domain-containing protein [Bdellovibrionales bacterium]
MNVEELEALENKASVNNEEKNITGFLVYDGFNFFQYIEGARKDIEALYEKIQKDKRHLNITELSSGEIQERLLPQWSMKCYLPGDFMANDRVHILNLLCAKHEKESIAEIVSSLQFAGVKS